MKSNVPWQSLIQVCPGVFTMRPATNTMATVDNLKRWRKQEVIHTWCVWTKGPNKATHCLHVQPLSLISSGTDPIQVNADLEGQMVYGGTSSPPDISSKDSSLLAKAVRNPCFDCYWPLFVCHFVQTVMSWFIVSKPLQLLISMERTGKVAHTTGSAGSTVHFNSVTVTNARTM